jgi:acid phosphatase
LERPKRHAWAAVACLLTSLILAGTATAAPPELAGSSSVPSAATPSRAGLLQPQQAAGVPLLDHVILVVMENHSYAEVKGLPYISTLITHYTSFSQSYAVGHPSQPNYLALWAASMLGVSDDNCPPAGSPYTAPNLGQACEVVGKTWKSYCENLPSVGSTVCSSPDNLYRRKHHACPDFSNLNHAHECPYTQLAADIAANALPNLAFVAPNMCDDMHDCSTTVGDTWLSNNLPAMISAVGPRGIVILTWDEDDKSASNNILTVFAGPPVFANYVSATTITHYSVVRTICDVLGLVPMANAVTSPTPTDVWNLAVTGVEPPAVTGLALSQPYPDPFQGTMTATLALPSTREVRAFVVDAAGRRVRSLFAGERTGTSAITWDGSRDDGSRASPGLYFLYVKSGSEQQVRSVALTR